MTLYDILKKKGTKRKTRDKVIYVEEKHYEGLVCNIKYTYEDVLELVDEFCRIGKEDFQLLNMNFQDVLPSNERFKCVIVKNTVETIAFILALMKSGYIPILIDAKRIRGRNSDDIIRASLKNAKELNTITSESGIVISSSGSENKLLNFHFLDERRLTKLFAKYGKDDSIFYGYISPANISGVLTNIVNPLIHGIPSLITNNFGIYNSFFDKANGGVNVRKFLLSERDFELQLHLLWDEIEPKKVEIVGDRVLVKMGKDTASGPYIGSIHISIIMELFKNNLGYSIIGNIIRNSRPRKPESLNSIILEKVFLNPIQKKNLLKPNDIFPNTIMLPRDILTYLENVNLSDVDFSMFDHIYLAGGLNSMETIKKLRSMIPSIKPNVFENLYGSTEACGVICSCNERDFKECYISLKNFQEGEIVFTFDKKTFYQRKDGRTRKINYEFNDIEFTSYLNVSSKHIKKTDINDDLSISINGEVLNNDMGIYIGDRLYVLGRRSDMLLYDGKTYNLVGIENYLSRICGATVYCSQDDNNTIAVFVYDDDYDFEKLMDVYKKLSFCLNEISGLRFNEPVIVNRSVFPKQEVFGKISKSELKKFSVNLKTQSYSVWNYPNSKRKAAEDFLTKVFEGYEYSDIDENNCFTLRLNSHQFFFPAIGPFARILEVIDFDDNLSIIRYKLKDSFIFVTVQEIEKIKNTCVTNDVFYKHIEKNSIGDIYPDTDLSTLRKPIDLTSMEPDAALKQLMINSAVRFINESRVNHDNELMVKVLTHDLDGFRKYNRNSGGDKNDVL